jgi:hypothetical protein
MCHYAWWLQPDVAPPLEGRSHLANGISELFAGNPQGRISGNPDEFARQLVQIEP